MMTLCFLSTIPHLTFEPQANLSALAKTIEDAGNASLRSLAMTLKDLDQIENDRVQAGFAQKVQHDSREAERFNTNVKSLRVKIAAARGPDAFDYGLQHTIDQILAEAEIRQMIYENRSKRFGDVSNFLFVLGLALGLTGQLSKEELITDAG